MRVLKFPYSTLVKSGFLSYIGSMAIAVDPTQDEISVCPSCHHRGPSPCAQCGRVFSPQPITRHRIDPLEQLLGKTTPVAIDSVFAREHGMGVYS